jgi:carbamoyl-phosphate synthase large subunit
MTILFTSAGRRVALIRAFYRAFETLGISGRVVATDLSATAPALYAVDRGCIVPPVTSPEYIEVLEAICRSEDVTAIIPTIDPDLPVLAAAREQIEGSTGARVIVSPPELIQLTSDKRRTPELFARAGVRHPRQYERSEVEAGQVAFPVFAKPPRGFAAVGTQRLDTADDLRSLLARSPDTVVEEYIEGPEYSCDVLCDLSGGLVAAVPRRRLEVRAGEVTRTRTEEAPDIVEAVERVCDGAGFRGPIILQCLLDEQTGPPCFFEINARFGGGVLAAIGAGADYPRYLLEMLLGRKPSYRTYERGLYLLRYEDAIYRRELIEDGTSVWRER